MQQLLYLLHTVVEHYLQLLLLQNHQLQLLPPRLTTTNTPTSLALHRRLVLRVGSGILIKITLTFTGKLLIKEHSTVQGGIPQNIVLLLKLFQHLNLIEFQLLKSTLRRVYLTLLAVVRLHFFSQVGPLIVREEMVTTLGVGSLQVAAIWRRSDSPLHVPPILLLWTSQQGATMWRLLHSNRLLFILLVNLFYQLNPLEFKILDYRLFIGLFCLIHYQRSQLQQISQAMLTCKFKSKVLPIGISIFRFNFSQKGQKRHFFNIIDEQTPKTPIVHPKQYPNNLVDASPLIKRGRPARFLSPRDQIPQSKMMSHDDLIIRSLYNDEWRSPQNSYKLNVGLIGPINSGKSQLLAKLSHKVSAVSPKMNTTNQILHAFKSFQLQSEQGIRNVQLKYFDTPGLAHHKTGFVSKGWKVLGQIDFSLLIIDSSKRFDDLLQQSINRLEKHRSYERFMKALVLNKVDLVENKRKFHGLISQIEKYGKFDKIFYASALTGYGIEEIQKYLVKLAKKGDWEYPKEAKTTSSELEVAEEILKEALFHRTYNHVPYDLVLECEAIAAKSDGVDFVQFRVIVEDENVQRMVIGKKGQNIDWVRAHFKVNYAKIYSKEVQVSVRVVARKKLLMRDSEQIESSYYQQQTRQTFKYMEDKLYKQGKLIK